MPQDHRSNDDTPLPHTAPSSCQVAILTPPGRGAVASLVVFGDSAVRQVDTLFVPATAQSLDRFPTNRIVYGRWVSRSSEAPVDAPVDTSGEELVVIRRDAQTVEVHCHGGAAATDRIIRTLTAEGCEQVPAETWLAHQEPDRLIVEAQLAIARAPTARTATILLDQIQGSLTRGIHSILKSAAGHAPSAAKDQLQKLLDWAPLGLHLTTPWHVALVGPTNVGKSSLINAILGYQRALVSHTAGTTRDILTDTTAIEGWPIELADTAGLRRSESAIEREGIRRAREQASSADLVLVVADLTEPWTSEYRQTVDQLKRPYLLVHNKADRATFSPADRPAGILTSALESTGIENLVEAIAHRLVPQPPPLGTAIPFLPRHEQSLRHALQAICDGQPAAAEKELRSLLTRKS